MVRAVDVVDYIRSRKKVSGEVQLQKLVYYAQAWSLVWDGQPLFDDRIEAWKMGPVVPAIRHMPPGFGNGEALSATERATVDAVLEHYGGKYGTDLTKLTHHESPWLEVWGERGAGERCQDEIPHNSMRRFYTEQALMSEGPRRRNASTRVVGDDEVLAVATANAEIWSKTLEILSE